MKIRALLVALSTFAATTGPAAYGQVAPQHPQPTSAAKALAALSLMFVENKGQWDTDARFVARHQGAMTRMHDGAIALQKSSGGDTPMTAVVRLSFDGARDDVRPEADGELPTRFHYLVGPREKWHRHVRAYQRVVYREVWPGVDVRLRDAAGSPEYDIELAPHARLEDVVLRCDGADRMTLGDDGDLVLHTAIGALRQRPPVTYEVRPDGRRQRVPSRCVLIDARRFGFEVDRSDPSLALVVDPILTWSTYFGALGNDLIRGVTVDPTTKNVTVAGQTSSQTFFPAAGAQPTLTPGALHDGFVAQFDPSRSATQQLVWATYYGGSGDDEITAITALATGELYFCGCTDSADITPINAFQGFLNGRQEDGLVVKLSADGSAISWATYLGGRDDDDPRMIRIDGAGRVVVAGNTRSTAFAKDLTNGFQQVHGGDLDGFIAVLDPARTGDAQHVYSTYVGAFLGTPTIVIDVLDGIEVDPATPDIITFCGTTNNASTFGSHPAITVPVSASSTSAFFGRIDLTTPATAPLLRLFGTSSSSTQGGTIATDARGQIVLAGQSNRTLGTFGAFQEQSSNGDGYVARFTADATAVWTATHLRTSGFPIIRGLRIAPDDSIWIVGTTSNANYPMVGAPLDPTSPAFSTATSHSSEIVVSHLTPTLDNMTYSSFFGGCDNERLSEQSVHFDGDIVTIAGHLDYNRSSTCTERITTANPFQPGFGGGTGDGFVMQADLAAPSFAGGSLTFTTNSYAVGTSPYAVATGDLDGDGDPDIATANHGSDDVTPLINDGGGSLASQPAIALGGAQQPVALASGDLDGAGNGDDIVVACAGSDEIVTILNPTTAATVQRIALVPSSGMPGVRPSSVAVGPIDGGGTDDIVIGLEGSVLVPQQDGILVSMNGTLSRLTIPAGRARHVVDLVLADLDNNDSALELAALARRELGATGTDEILLFDNSGSGLAYSGYVNLGHNGPTDGLCAADIDADGDLDLLVALPNFGTPPFGSSQRARLYRNNDNRLSGSGAFSLMATFLTSGLLATAAECADIDSDLLPGAPSGAARGGVDLALVNAPNGTNSGSVELFLGVDFGLGSSRPFDRTVAAPAGNAPIDAVLVDLDGNGTRDIVVGNRLGDDVTVNLVDNTIQREFGVGCAGSNGVPRIGTSGPARTGSRFSVTVSNGAPGTTALLLISVGAQATVLPSSPCTLYVGVPLVQLVSFLDGSGDGAFPITVPPLPSLIGANLVFQWAISDSQGAFAGAFSFSDGLRIKIGG